IAGITSDVTWRRDLEEKLRASEGRYRKIFEQNPLPMLILDTDTFDFISVNDAAVKYYGYSKEEFADMNVSDIRPQEDSRTGSEYLRDIKYDQDFHEGIWGHRKKDGSLVYVDISTMRIDFEGKTARLALCKDLTEEIKTKESLLESEAQYRMLVENADASIMIVQDDKIRYANPISEEVFGYTFKELLKLSFSELIHADDREVVVDHYRRRLSGEEVHPDSFKLLDNEGNVKWVFLTAAKIEWQGEPATLNILRDVSEHKSMEAELHRAQKLESTGILAGGIAHDFNNLLTGIMGNISLARTLAGDDEKLLSKLDEADKACNRARDLTKQLLTFSKGGSPVVGAESIDGILKDSVDFALSGSNVKPHFNIPQNLWLGEVDPGQIGQVIQNIVINAIQAQPDGGVIEISAENFRAEEESGLPLEDGNYIKLTFKDTGIGIPPEYIDSIFDPYFTTKDEGSGLGLATVYSIVKNHGGQITVFSVVGKGTEFEIYLPASDTEVQFAFSDLEEVVLQKGHGKVLIMDDEEIIRDIARGMLEHLGYKVETANDGAEAIEKYSKTLNSEPFDVVILDLTIPGGLGGKEALDRMKELNPDIKAVVSSGYSNDPIMADFEAHGFTDVVAKPYSIDELKVVMNRLLESLWA
ncbi:MAG: PAS domain S-box protein, partial [bacterium]